jgi:hypothetical protein
MKPVNVPGMYEFYLGVRPAKSSKTRAEQNHFFGDRVFLRYDELIN